MPTISPANIASKLGSARRQLTIAIGALLVCTTLVVGGTTSAASASGPAADDWLGIVNVYRAQSGLAPVVNNPAWSNGTLSHSCWMLLNGIAHDEAPGTPGYTVEGDTAGNSSNVAVSSNTSATPRSHIDLWMSGPFHAIGILRSSLRESAFGICSSPSTSNTRWKSGATLDVIRGIDWAPRPATPIVFPGNGATTSLTRFVAESPDPRTFCGWGTDRFVGLPLIAMMPSDVTAANATLVGPSGPVATCVLHKSNTTGVASSILGGDNAVVVVPAAPLTTGTYTVSVGSDGGNANWSFNVDPSAPLALAPAAPPAPLTNTSALAAAMRFQPVTPFRFADSRHNLVLSRLPAKQQVRLQIAGVSGIPADITAISANFTAVGAPQAGYLTASNCAEVDPSFSTLNYEANDGVPNQAIIPLSGGSLCLFSSEPTDIVIDVNGYVSPSASQVFVPVPPKRLFDSRSSGHPMAPGQVLRVQVAGGASPAPAGAAAVAVNLTGILPDQTGYISAFPCGVAEPSISSLNPRVDRARANSAIVPTGTDGFICLTSNVTSHVIVDITGWFGNTGGQQFVPINPLRLADTRQTHPTLNGDAGPVPLTPGRQLRIQVAGTRGISAGARAATLNLVAVGATEPGFLVAVPCGGSSDVSNLNFTSGGAVANGANVKLDDSGAVCVTTSAATHVIVDITGIWE